MKVKAHFFRLGALIFLGLMVAPISMTRAQELYWAGGITSGPDTNIWTGSSSLFGWSSGIGGPAFGWNDPRFGPGFIPEGVFDAFAFHSPVNVSGTVDVYNLTFVNEEFMIDGGTLNLSGLGQNIFHLGQFDFENKLGTPGAAIVTSDISGSNGLDLWSGTGAYNPGVISGSAFSWSGSGTFTGDTSISDNATTFIYLTNADKLDDSSDLRLYNAAATFRNENLISSVTENVAGLELGSAASRVVIESYGGDLTVGLGTLSRTQVGATVILQSLSWNATFQTSSSDTNGMLHAGFLFNDGSSSNFASAAFSAVGAAATVDDDFTSPTSNVNLTGDANLLGDTTVNSLRIANALAPLTLDIGSGNTLLLQSGGILVSEEVADTVTIAGGEITTNHSGSEIFVYQLSSSTLNLESTFSGAGDRLILSGDRDAPGQVNVSGVNTHTGGTVINDLNVEIQTGASLGGGSLALNGFTAVVLNQSNTVADLDVAGDSTLEIASGQELTVDTSQNSRILGSVFGDGTLRKNGLGDLTTPFGGTISTVVEIDGGTVVGSAADFTNTVNINSGGRLRMVNNQGNVSGANFVLDGGRFEIGAGTTVDNQITWNSGSVGGNGTMLGSLTIDTGKILAPGESPGTSTFAGQTWAGGGVYEWEINDLLGTAGLDPGWDLISIEDGAPTTNILDISASFANKFTISIIGLTAANEVGATPGWDNSLSHTWLIAQATDGITGFSIDSFNFDISQFAPNNPLGGGTFSLSLMDSDTELWLNFTPVPEPSSALLIGIGLLAILAANRRRRTS